VGLLVHARLLVKYVKYTWALVCTQKRKSGYTLTKICTQKRHFGYIFQDKAFYDILMPLGGKYNFELGLVEKVGVLIVKDGRMSLAKKQGTGRRTIFFCRLVQFKNM